MSIGTMALGASLAAAVAARGLREGRRRSAINEAVHELRRPLQALALAVPGRIAVEPAAIDGSVRMAAAALERLERELNGEGVPPLQVTPQPLQPLLGAAVERWRPRAARAGSSLALRWRAGEAAVAADACAFAQALDNLIVNAIEHGGPVIVVSAALRGDCLRIVVADSGAARRSGSRRSLAAISGRRGRGRRGHGLRVVRRTVLAHGGEFRLGAGRAGSEAVIELPLARVGAAA